MIDDDINVSIILCAYEPMNAHARHCLLLLLFACDYRCSNRDLVMA